MKIIFFFSLFVFLVGYSQSELGKRILKLYKKDPRALQLKCDSTDLDIGTTPHFIACMQREFLILDSMIYKKLDSVFFDKNHEGQKAWENYRDDQCNCFFVKENNLWRNDYYNCLVTITRKRLEFLMEMHLND